jgi:HPt (histidine-containing phosphotransfer) domain-containing protein
MSKENVNEIELAARFPGVDATKALKRFKGNAAFFIRLLRMFNSHYAGTDAEIRQALDAGDMDKAGQLSHTLKGVAINLEAWELFAASRALETAIKSGESAAQLDKLFSDFETAFCTAQVSAKGLVGHFETDKT